jgi:hypothetical protein
MKKWMVVLMVLVGMNALAQITFVKTYFHDEGYSVQQTSDGGYIITGWAYLNGNPIFLIKTNADGDTLWTRTYGNVNESNVGYSVQQTNDGGYVIVGTTELSIGGQNDVYLIKTNSIGDTLWTKSYGSTGNDYGYSVKQTLDNGFIIAGATDGLGAGNNDAFLIKTNSIGDTLWTKTYGGDSSDWAGSVELTTDGGYIIAGSTKSFGAGNHDIYLIKTDSIGDTLWTKTYGSGNDDYGYSVKQTSDGGYIISGSYNSNYFYLIKTNSIGDTLWTKTYFDDNFNSFNEQSGYCVQQTIDGGYIIAGTAYAFGLEGLTYTQIVLIKTNSTGDTLWTKFYIGSIYYPGNSVQQSTDGGYIILDETESASGFILIKTDANGNSGCSYDSSLIINNSFPTQVSNTSTIIKSGCIVSNPSNLVGSSGADGIFIECFNTGINEIKTASTTSIYPNPFSTTATLVINGVETQCIASLQIINLLGQEVKTIPIINQNEITINRDNLADGMYFYKIINNKNETIAVGKMVVE